MVKQSIKEILILILLVALLSPSVARAQEGLELTAVFGEVTGINEGEGEITVIISDGEEMTIKLGEAEVKMGDSPFDINDIEVGQQLTTVVGSGDGQDEVTTPTCKMELLFLKSLIEPI